MSILSSDECSGEDGDGVCSGGDDDDSGLVVVMMVMVLVFRISRLSPSSR